jgi:hypothetical protein
MRAKELKRSLSFSFIIRRELNIKLLSDAVGRSPTLGSAFSMESN